MKKSAIFLLTPLFFISSICFGAGSFDELDLSGKVQLKLVKDEECEEFSELVA